MKRLRIAVILLVLVTLGVVSWRYISVNPQVLGKIGFSTSPPPGVLASGFVEATDVAIAPETGGRIVSISVAEGDWAKTGALLFKLDDSLLRAQERQAEAAVKLAQATVEQAVASRNQAIVSRDGARKIWENALDVQKNPLELESRITAAQNELNAAELALRYEKEEILKYLGATSKSLYWTYASATQRRDNAKAMLQSLLDIKNNPQEINAAADRARNTYDTAVAAVEVAEKAVATAERQVEQAKASLEVIRTQLGKLTITSPISGQVAARNAEMGEVVPPGIAVLTITEMEEVTLTAYVPESKLGLVKVGQEALVSVDSYPGREFAGRVVSIGTRALFTPKNIQLKEEREKTVFPVKIRLANPDHKLKPGMPADARILVAERAS